MARGVRPSRKEIARSSNSTGGRQARPTAVKKAMLRRKGTKRLRYDGVALAFIGALLLLGLALDHLVSG